MLANNLMYFNIKSYIYDHNNFIEYFYHNDDRFIKSYEVDITLHYKYNGKHTIDKDHFMHVNLDRFLNGYPITSINVYKPEGVIHFKNLKSVLPQVYILGTIDIDLSGWSSKGDPIIAYRDEMGNRIPISLLNGPLSTDIEFGDDFLDN